MLHLAQTDAASRLKVARINAGFPSAKAACERFGWLYDTYAQHENGTRGLGRKAGDYARAYGVSEAWLVYDSGPGPGFEDSSVAPYIPPRSRGTSPGTNPPSPPAPGSPEAMAKAATPRPDTEVWRIQGSNLAALGFLPGDYILIDPDHEHREPPGKTVLVAVKPTQLRRAPTYHLATLAPPYAVVLGVRSGEATLLRIDDQHVDIKGVVTGSWRIHD